MKMVAAQGKTGKTAVQRNTWFGDALKEEKVENLMKRCNDKQVTQNKDNRNVHCQAAEEEYCTSNVLQAGERQK